MVVNLDMGRDKVRVYRYGVERIDMNRERIKVRGMVYG